MEANSKKNSKSVKKDKQMNPYYAITQARGVLTDTVGQIMNNFGLPPYVMDGIICDVLSEVRKKELHDLGYIYMEESQKPKEEDDGEHSNIS